MTANVKEKWLGIRQFRDETIEEELVGYLRSLDSRDYQNISIEEIEGEYNLWLRDHEKRMVDGNVPPELEGFAARIGSYCLKLSILFELSDNPKAESISPDTQYDSTKSPLKYQARPVALIMPLDTTKRPGVVAAQYKLLDLVALFFEHAR